MAARTRRAYTEDWQQIQQFCLWPEQALYERARPIVLFGDLPAERAAQTGASERTLRWQAESFERHGMAALLRPSPRQRDDHHRSLPPPIRQCIVDLQMDYPAFSLRDLAQICYVQFGRRPSHHTIKQVVLDGPSPSRSTHRFPPYAEITDPFTRRHAIITLHAEGWPTTAIAAYLQVARSTAYEVLKRFKEEGFAGLEDKSRANTRPVRKVTLAIKQQVQQLQENPELGAFRIHAALRREGIHLSQATCGHLLAENRQLYGLSKPPREVKLSKEHPYKAHPYQAQYRHQIWSVDVRYIEHHQIPGLSGPFYIISVLENFSRAILASDVFQRQDLTAYLLVLYAAIAQHGSPELLVSDSGGIFHIS